MKKTRLSEAQIIAILKEGESGIAVEELCRKHSIGRSTYYKWRSRYGGMEVSELKKLKALEEEHRRLKELFARVSLDKQILQDIVEGKI